MVVSVGLTVGGWFASAVISKLFTELIDYAKGQQKMRQELKEEFARLEKALPKIQAMLDATDQGQLIRGMDKKSLENWLWQLRDAVDQSDDVMDEIKYNYEKEKVEPKNNQVNQTFSNFKTSFLHDNVPFLERLKEAVKAIDNVGANVGELFVLVKDLVKDHKKMAKSVFTNRETSSLLNKGTQLFGREKEKDDIIKKLLNPDCKTQKNNLAVLPIIGVGGVGKTTLVRDVYNDSIVKDHFKLRMWVCISNNFDKVLLTKKLYKSACGERADFNNTFPGMQEDIKKELQSQKILVVFDDVWYDNNNNEGWNDLITPLTYGQSGSMVLLTTRMKPIPALTGASLMDTIILEGLNECSLWDLFKECAFGVEDPDNHEELVKIGRAIVKKP